MVTVAEMVSRAPQAASESQDPNKRIFTFKLLNGIEVHCYGQQLKSFSGEQIDWAAMDPENPLLHDDTYFTAEQKIIIKRDAERDLAHRMFGEKPL